MDSPDTLLEHATWLRRLAASLVGDPTLADDLVQDTWVAALRSPPDRDRPIRPWLARVVRNAARFRWRGEKNRAAREAITASHAETATPTSEELLARHQLQQLLSRLVGDLDEPYRATILLRYAEGLAPTQIARRLEIPAGTVRWRIKEGLERLRRGLDAAHGGDRKVWLLALAPIALWPRSSHAATAVSVGLAIAAAAAIAVILGGVQREPTSRSGSTNAGGLNLPTLVTQTRLPAASSWFVQPGASPRHVTGRVVRDGVAVPDAQVRLVADDAGALETRTDVQGRFDFGAQDARTVVLGAATPDALAAIRHIDLRDPAVVADVELPLLPCSARIWGKVTDASGNAIPHAQILREDTIGTEADSSGAYDLCALPTAALISQLDVVVRADGYGAIAAGVAPAGRIRRDFVLAPEASITGTAVPDAAIWIDPDRDDPRRSGERAARQVAIADHGGRFRFTGASGGRYRVGGAARGMLAVTTLISVEAGGTTDVSVRMAPAATVRGRVLVHGTPVAGVHVAVRSGGVVVRHDDPSRDEIAAVNAVTQGDGSFVLDGLPVGRTAFTAVPVRIVTPPSALVAGDNSIVLEAEPAGCIRGVVRRHGVPVAYARVDMGGTSGRGVTSDGAGRYKTDGLEPGKYGFYADDQRREAFIETELITLKEAETRDYDIELAWGAPMHGHRQVDPDGRTRCERERPLHLGGRRAGALHGTRHNRCVQLRLAPRRHQLHADGVSRRRCDAPVPVRDTTSGHRARCRRGVPWGAARRIHPTHHDYRGFGP